MDIKDKIFVITGAASGLGMATVEHLRSKGAGIIAIDIRNSDDLPELLYGHGISYQVCDVRAPEELHQALQRGKEEFGVIHGAIACAGVAPAMKIHSGRKGSHTVDEFMRTIKINLAGTFHLFNGVVPHLKSNIAQDPDGERGVLIATSSIAAHEGQIGQVAYAASKGGVSAMILPLARELARSGIRVNAIAPGIFQTPMVAGFPKDVQESLASEVPFPGRLGQPHEFAALAVHIIENPYINGAEIRLDGGIRMR